MSSRDDEVVGQKRKKLERTTRSNKSRRVIDDDDDDHEDVSKMNSIADDVKSRLLGRVKKSGERSRVQERKDADRKKEVKADNTMKAKKEPSIPKKKGAEKDSFSLLSSLKAPTNTSSTTARAESSSSPIGNQQRPAAKSNQKQRLEPPPLSKMTVSNSMVGTKSSHLLAEPGLNQRPSSSLSSSTHPRTGKKPDSGGLPAMVWQSLSELCDEATQIEDKPFRLIPQKPSSGIDLSSSMMKYREPYDWFDVDAQTGGIVLQKKIPIFPEDFPPGVALHDLKWWGIVDPAIGARKGKGTVTDILEVNEKESKEKLAPENDNRPGKRAHSRGSRDRTSPYRGSLEDRRERSRSRTREERRRFGRIDEHKIRSDRSDRMDDHDCRGSPPKHPEERGSRGRYLEDSRLSRHREEHRARHDRPDGDRSLY